MEHSRRIDKIWEIMIAVYGQAFISVHGIEPNAVWSIAIEDIGDQRLQFALEEIIRGKSPFLDYPPTAPAFAAFARSLTGFVQKTVEPEYRVEQKPLSDEEKLIAEKKAEEARQVLKDFVKNFKTDHKRFWD